MVSVSLTLTPTPDSVNALMPHPMLPFVPAAELSSLLTGSFQDTTSRVADALREESHSLFGGRDAQLLGVFPDYAVVLTDDGNVAKMRFESSASGSVYFTGTEFIPVTVVTEKNLRRYVQKEASAAADLFLRGLTDRANDKIRDLAPLVDAASVVSDDEILQSFSESRSERMWRNVTDSRKSHVTALLEGSELPAALAPKFSKLYDGSTGADELPRFAALVTDDVEHLLGRLASVESQASSALHTARMVRDAAVAAGGEAAIAALEAFASDLLSDVTQVKEFVVEATTEFGKVDRIAKVFDSIALEVASFEVAGAFAAKMAARLNDAKETEG